MGNAMRGLDPIVIEFPDRTELWCRLDEIPVIGAAIRAVTGELSPLICLVGELAIFSTQSLNLRDGCELLKLVRGGWPIEELDGSTLRYRVSLARQLETMDPSPRCQL
jgi:hypothetical protein